MTTATKLIEETKDFARQNPEQRDFARKLIDLIEQIQVEFSGDACERLLGDARKTFDRQREVIKTTQSTLEALERLRRNQAELIDALTQLAAFRPESTTVH